MQTPARRRRLSNAKGSGSLPRSRTGWLSWRSMCGGKELSSEQLAARLHEWQMAGVSLLVVVIGGDLGISRAVLKRADLSLSLSPMTFTHQMVRMIILEQLYRACRINSGEPYHK